MSGVLDLERDDSRVRVTYRTFPDVEPGAQIDMITFDDVDYIRPAGDRTWLKTETTAEDAISNALDVPSSLNTLGGVTGDAEDLGSEDLAGIPTTRYRGTVDPDRVAETLPPEQAERYREQAKPLGDELPIEIWVDGDQRIRRLKYDLELDRPGPFGGSVEMLAVVTLSDFGVRARVAPPPRRLTTTE